MCCERYTSEFDIYLHYLDKFRKEKATRMCSKFLVIFVLWVLLRRKDNGKLWENRKLERNCFKWLRIKLPLTRKICKVATTLCTNLLNTKSHGSRMSLFCARIYGSCSSQITYVGFSTKTRLVAGHVIQDPTDA